tara:strand:- start:2486 stop:2938 length:453 start_codon:yes stop_codon:yes gene_type:complete
VIQEITSQTLSGTNDTATSIGELAEMAVEMKHSVSGFILPDSDKNQSLNEAQESDSDLDKDLDDDQLGAMFAVATDPQPEQEEGVTEQPFTEDYADSEGLNLDFVASNDLDEDFNEDLEVDIEDPEELLHLEEFEAEIEAMLSDGGDKKT